MLLVKLRVSTKVTFSYKHWLFSGSIFVKSSAFQMNPIIIFSTIRIPRNPFCCASLHVRKIWFDVGPFTTKFMGQENALKFERFF